MKNALRITTVLAVAWLKTHTPDLTGPSDCYRLSRPKEYTPLGIWFRVLEDALILLYEEIHAETAGYYDCGCGVAGKL